MDATTIALAELDDPAIYTRYEGIPIFKPHKKKKRGSDGKVREITVTVEDLEEIARNAQDLEDESGVPARIIPGHTKSDRNADEKTQPAPVGYAKKFRVGNWGPAGEKGLLATFYLRNDQIANAKGYPFRSPEYYPKDKSITAIALLRRDPELDLGIVNYGRGHGPAYHYGMENSMDPTKDPIPAASEMEPETPALEPTHEQKMEEFCKHCMSHPYAKYMADHYGGPAEPLQPEIPVEEAEVDVEVKEPVNMAKDETAIRYARELKTLDGRLKAAEDALARQQQATALAERAARLTRYESELKGLQGEGYEMDMGEEMEDAQSETPEQFQRHVKRIVTHYQRAPISTTRLPVTTAKVEQGKQQKATAQPEVDQIVRYMEEKKIPWDQWDRGQREYYAAGNGAATGK